jgi:hypothetical protein
MSKPSSGIQLVSFDACFGESCGQIDIFNHVKPLVDGVLLGRNTTVTVNYPLSEDICLRRFWNWQELYN